MRTLVFGASLKSHRYSYLAVKKLTSKGVDTVAFGLREGNIGAVKVETSLHHITDIDTVTLYMNPVRQKPFYEAIIALHPRRVIFNPGTENPEFYLLLEREGIQVAIACTLVLLSTDQYHIA